MDLLIGNVFGGIGPISNLIDIIPDGRQFPEKGNIFIGWPGPKFNTHNQLPYQWLYSQAGFFGDGLQMGIFFGGKANEDGFYILPHSITIVAD